MEAPLRRSGTPNQHGIVRFHTRCAWTPICWCGHPKIAQSSLSLSAKTHHAVRMHGFLKMGQHRCGCYPICVLVTQTTNNRNVTFGSGCADLWKLPGAWEWWGRAHSFQKRGRAQSRGGAHLDDQSGDDVQQPGPRGAPFGLSPTSPEMEASPTPTSPTTIGSHIARRPRRRRASPLQAASTEEAHWIWRQRGDSGRQY